MRSPIANILSGLMLIVAVAVNATESGTTPSQIRAEADEFLSGFADAQAEEGFDVRYEVGALDDRLNLAPCREAMAVSFARDPFRSDRQTLEVRCEGERPWRLFLSARVKIHGPAYVASRALGRNTRLTRSMVREEQVMINGVREGAIRDLSSVVGMRLDRPVSTGTVLTPRLLSEPDAVARGDHVMISAGSGAFRVRSRGKALGNAQTGEQVMVENLSSSRTVRARVVAPGRVEIPM
ncbi:flagella basal body P-ring formation protein FlgA [Tamilnaduibacter salinus]|uniref:Flagella basal body P-ring formation protein FlgA n=1 Tax=Tamilnaduibacter salinus TaxID=1484056 RepID=A0A2A2I1G6_9GAMM|nr:flagellar basal body P-ring formation chaperone FlgA [Tamilnaduibacter salinus]PAV25146.1 flagella basal body P-ring formation protein FlgA [Tamilnaduibacter salinus]PVY78051.1 flagella basal body P-ring formation protein FlgA [Tamilnaduibacter salinus]